MISAPLCLRFNTALDYMSGVSPGLSANITSRLRRALGDVPLCRCLLRRPSSAEGPSLPPPPKRPCFAGRRGALQTACGIEESYSWATSYNVPSRPCFSSVALDFRVQSAIQEREDHHVVEPHSCARFRVPRRRCFVPLGLSPDRSARFSDNLGRLWHHAPCVLLRDLTANDALTGSRCQTRPLAKPIACCAATLTWASGRRRSQSTDRRCDRTYIFGQSRSQRGS
jgi:hypothetical protein